MISVFHGLGRQHIRNGILTVDQGKTDGGEEAHLETGCIPS
jgi:integrase